MAFVACKNVSISSSPAHQKSLKSLPTLIQSSSQLLCFADCILHFRSTLAAAVDCRNHNEIVACCAYRVHVCGDILAHKRFRRRVHSPKYSRFETSCIRLCMYGSRSPHFKPHKPMNYESAHCESIERDSIQHFLMLVSNVSSRVYASNELLKRAVRLFAVHAARWLSQAKILLVLRDTHVCRARLDSYSVFSVC